MAAPWRMVVRSPGGPEAITREAFDPGEPGPGELLLAQEAIGLNFIDVYYRTGLYPSDPGQALGDESVGRIIAIGPDVTGFAVGERVGAVGGGGAYATHRIVPARRVVRVPDDIASEDAAVLDLLLGLGFVLCLVVLQVADLLRGGGDEDLCQVILRLD